MPVTSFQPSGFWVRREPDWQILENNPDRWYWRMTATNNGEVHIHADRWFVIRRTPCGAWLSWDPEPEGTVPDRRYGHKLVIDHWAKRFAARTWQQALRDLRRRTEHRLRHAKRQLEDAEAIHDRLTFVDNFKEENQ